MSAEAASSANHNGPRVTVVMAAHNASATVGAAIESIEQQSLEDWELLVVDDASTDHTRQIVEAHASRDPRVRLIHLETNVGSGTARNMAMASAHSALIAVLDADDIALPRRLELQVARFDADVDLDVLGGQLAEFGDWGGPDVKRWPVDGDEIRDSLLRGRMRIAHPTVMFRRELALEVGGYDGFCRRAQDFALMRRLAPRAKFAALNDVVVLYRTTRPVPLRYVILSDRYAKLARQRTEPSPSLREQPSTFPASLLSDLRSIVVWARRRVAERRYVSDLRRGVRSV